jgi:hypothetical protein
LSQCLKSLSDDHQDMAGANIANSPSLNKHRDTSFAHPSLAVSFTLDHSRGVCSLFKHRQYRHFRSSTTTSLFSSPTSFPPQLLHRLSSVIPHHLSRMASNTEFSHRRSSSAVSSVDEVTSNDGTLSGPASTVPTARSTPFIGPHNHPGIPVQHHPAVPALSLDNNGVYGNHQPHDTAFASQLAGIETQMRLLDSIGSGYG